MFERFTEQARQVIVLAQEEARSLWHEEIGTGHLLLGLIRVGGISADVLSDVAVDLDATRSYLSSMLPKADGEVSGQIPFTAGARRVIELALREALSLGNNYIGTEHLLLALTREVPTDELLTRFFRLRQLTVQTVRMVVSKRLSDKRSYRRPITDELSVARAAGVDRWKVRQTEIVYANRSRANRLRRKQAANRAESLLREHLTDEQLTEWTSEKAFHVETRDGTRRYRLALGLAGNVRVVRLGDEPAIAARGVRLREGSYLCAHVYHPEGRVPDADNVLAQKFMLESAEDEFLAMANAS